MYVDCSITLKRQVQLKSHLETCLDVVENLHLSPMWCQQAFEGLCLVSCFTDLFIEMNTDQTIAKDGTNNVGNFQARDHFQSAKATGTVTISESI